MPTTDPILCTGCSTCPRPYREIPLTLKLMAFVYWGDLSPQNPTFPPSLTLHVGSRIKPQPDNSAMTVHVVQWGKLVHKYQYVAIISLLISARILSALVGVYTLLVLSGCLVLFDGVDCQQLRVHLGDRPALPLLWVFSIIINNCLMTNIRKYSSARKPKQHLHKYGTRNITVSLMHGYMWNKIISKLFQPSSSYDWNNFISARGNLPKIISEACCSS